MKGRPLAVSTRLGLFALALVAVVVVGFAIGAAVGPIDDPSPGHTPMVITVGR